MSEQLDDLLSWEEALMDDEIWDDFEVEVEHDVELCKYGF